MIASISSGSGFGFDSREMPKNRVSDSSSEMAPPWMPWGTWISAISMKKLSARLEMMATFAASAVARFQLKPIATVGTNAAANVPQPKVPRRATRSSLERLTKSAAPTARASVAVRAQKSSFLSGLPVSALGMSWMIAAAPMFRKPSAVDMIAAKRAAKTMPARIGWAYA